MGWRAGGRQRSTAAHRAPRWRTAPWDAKKQTNEIAWGKHLFSVWAESGSPLYHLPHAGGGGEGQAPHPTLLLKELLVHLRGHRPGQLPHVGVDVGRSQRAAGGGGGRAAGAAVGGGQ